MKCAINMIDIITDIINSITSWLSIPMILLLVYEAFLRYVLGKPTVWSYDISYFLCSLMVVMGLSYTLKEKGHVSVDIFFSYLPDRWKSAINIICYIGLFIPCWLLLLIHMVPFVIHSWEIGEVTTSSWRVAYYPFKTWICLGVALFIFQATSEILKNITELR